MDGGFGLNVFNLISLGVVFYGLLIVLLLLASKSSHKNSNRMLAAILVIGVWYIITSLLILTGTFINFAFLFRLGLPFYYAIPPLLYLYVKSRADKDFRFRYIQLLHFIPVLLTIIDLVPFYLSDAESKQAVVKLMAQDLKNVLMVRTGILPDIWHVVLRPLHGLVYTVVTGSYLYKALQNKKQRKEVEIHKNLKTWLWLFTLFFALIYAGLLILDFIWMFLPYSGPKLLNMTLVPLLFCLAPFLAMHIFLFFNTQIIFGKLPLRGKDTERPPHPEEKGDAQFHEIEKWVLEKQLFKNPKLTAPEMAGIMGMAPHVFSALLNAHGRKFSDFINAYRINYVLAELDKGSNENMSIEGIATEAGFASRSAFYNSFKKTTGLTPSEYLKNKS